ncbi:DUF6913 domain-containing protein [Galbibacter pacificus]|uniref:Uncharacterized protein n=1 Tax=Galbibacter pacificus TaxID=2996052 RepID=A0ABT6FRV4_9FLAO|nr:hypothetical protein [Galbibacter pacificus]MDG3581679.1 hypothetical protein [Galbibacter pacificus]MDG3585847.1 hypothetical protein [Galbibacter pacificus]
MIFKGLKEKSIRKTIQKVLSKPMGLDKCEGVLHSLAIIIDYDKLVDYKPLLNIAKAINISNENIFILGYVDKMYKNVNYLIPVFSDSSIGMNGKIKTDELGSFLKREYDIVINYFTEPNIYLELVSVLSKSSLKVGISEKSEAINNLVLKVNEKDFSQFNSELVKYLTILKRI